MRQTELPMQYKVYKEKIPSRLNSSFTERFLSPKKAERLKHIFLEIMQEEIRIVNTPKFLDEKFMREEEQMNLPIRRDTYHRA